MPRNHTQFYWGKAPGRYTDQTPPKGKRQSRPSQRRRLTRRSKQTTKRDEQSITWHNAQTWDDA